LVGLSVYALTCPSCGHSVKVPAGRHVVAEIQTTSGQRTGIAIDGKAVHRCDDAVSPDASATLLANYDAVYASTFGVVEVGLHGTLG
jgi:hypothetical protein